MELSIYQGYSLQGVDIKGRVTIPAALRVTLEERTPAKKNGEENRTIVLTTHPREQCLIGFDVVHALDRQRRFTMMEEASAARGEIDYSIKRKGTGAAEALAFDSSGRFIMSDFPRDYAGITSHAFFYGVGDYFEIWNPQTLIECPSADDVQKAAARFYMKKIGAAL